MDKVVPKRTFVFVVIMCKFLFIQLHAVAVYIQCISACYINVLYPKSGTLVRSHDSRVRATVHVYTCTSVLPRIFLKDMGIVAALFKHTCTCTCA